MLRVFTIICWRNFFVYERFVFYYNYAWLLHVLIARMVVLVNKQLGFRASRATAMDDKLKTKVEYLSC